MGEVRLSRRYFGTDGIRGRVGEEPMTPEFVLRLGYAAGRVFAEEGTSTVLIGKDTRLSCYMYESALQAGFCAAGVNVRLLGPMPTPGVAYLTKTFRASAGVVISASHNPYHDNGVKFFATNGSKLPDATEEAIEARLEAPIGELDASRLGRVSRINDAQGRYVEFCKSAVGSRISLTGMRIALDCANGATYHIAPHVLAELGAEVIPMGVEPDGLNINHDCGSTSPAALASLVLEREADLGVALDGDGDRVVMVDRKGRVLDGDRLLYIIALDRLRTGELRGPVVGTQMSNLGLEQALRGAGIDFERARVGDRHVLEMLQRQGGTIGGESSGHILCLDRASTGDGIISALQVLSVMVATGKDLDALLSGLTLLPQIMINVPLNGRDVMRDEAVRKALSAVESALEGRGRVLLRPSGTEPLIRVMVEGPDEKQVRGHAEDIAEAVRAAQG